MPRHQILWLLILFFGTLPAIVPFTRHVAGIIDTPLSLPGMLIWFQAGLCYIALALIYIITYSALEEDSPSLCLLRYVDAAGDAGRDRQELMAFLTREPIIEMRLNAGIRDGLFIKNGDRVMLSAKGERLSIVFKKTQKILRMETGG